jgi:septum formation protein
LELLAQFGHNVRVAACDIDESCALPPLAAVVEISRRKAFAAEPRGSEIVIAADTLVELDGLPLGKPRDETEARETLKRLSGRWHIVRTGVTVGDGSRWLSESETTRVKFAELTAREIRSYVASGEPMDKAGSYGIQGRGALFVSAIEGDFYNVMGLPLFKLGRMLTNFGIKF